MQFPLINIAINMTLMYYTKYEIVKGVGEISKFMQHAGVTFSGKLLPHWQDMVLNSHVQMEEEIQQIISLNYPYVRNIVFENLRHVLTDIRIKSLNVELITSIADENNKEETEQFESRNLQGFALLINKDYLLLFKNS